ncbi:hypothetical protein C8F04DRAFT_1077288 [Mycena alexandri]|uniref:MYND-type domain-containing protein n=1 Tax=Mycena alexandri TaxID=1745969 RepID=A0AAD6TAY2_9AGAR|nr:hypothetical protein C8F04DRAFT_1077288 [Mycena alexandri]
MPSYPADSLVHKIREHSCTFPGCKNSKLRGASMHLCKGCDLRFYCGTDCQRPDWPRHKDECRRQAACEEAAKQTHGTLSDDFKAWHAAMGPLFFTEICVHGLGISDRPEHIQTKFIVLGVQERLERPSTPLKMFTYKGVAVLDRTCLEQFLGPGHGVHEEMRESDEQAKRQGKAGAALILVYITPAEGRTHPNKYFRVMPIILRMEELQPKKNIGPQWKDGLKYVVNDGKSLKRVFAKQEKRGELAGATWIKPDDPVNTDTL